MEQAASAVEEEQSSYELDKQLVNAIQEQQVDQHMWNAAFAKRISYEKILSNPKLKWPSSWDREKLRHRWQVLRDWLKQERKDKDDFTFAELHTVIYDRYHHQSSQRRRPRSGTSRLPLTMH